MVQTFKIEIPHQLGKDEAARRLRQGFGRFESQMSGVGVRDFQSAWAEDRLSFTGQAMGQTVSGRLDVEEDRVRVELDLPNILAALGGAIKGKLKREGALLLEDRRKKP